MSLIVKALKNCLWIIPRALVNSLLQVSIWKLRVRSFGSYSTEKKSNWCKIFQGLNNRMWLAHYSGVSKGFSWKSLENKRHLKTSGEYSGQNIMRITTKMRTISYVNRGNQCKLILPQRAIFTFKLPRLRLSV